MKLYITINQEFCLRFGLDIVDACILQWFSDFENSGKMTPVLNDGEIFYYVSYQKVIDDLPLLKIKTHRAIKDRFDKLVKKGLLKKFIRQNFETAFRKTELFFEYFETKNSGGGLFEDRGRNSETEGGGSKLQGGWKQTSRGGGSEIPHIDSYNSNVNIDSYNKIDTSCLNSKDYSNTNKTEINLSLTLNNQKEVKDIDNNIRYASSKAKEDNKKDNINKIHEKSFIGRGDFLRLSERFGSGVAGIVLKWAKENIKNPENYDIECLEYVIDKLRNRYIDKYEEFDEKGFAGFVLKSLKQGAYFYQINEGEFYDKKNNEKNFEKDLTKNDNDDIINYMIDEIMKDEELKSKMIVDLLGLKQEPDEHWERALKNLEKEK